MADEFDAFDLMLDSATGEPVFDARTGEFLLMAPTDNCCDPPVCGSIDVIHIIDGAPKRERLTRSTKTTLWTTDVTTALSNPGVQAFDAVWLQDEVEDRHQVAFRHDETPGVSFDGVNVVVTTDNTGDGDVDGVPYNEFWYEYRPPGPDDNGCDATLVEAALTGVCQEANGVGVGLFTEFWKSNCYPGWALSDVVTMSVGGELEYFDLPLPAWCSAATIYKGGGRIGDILYVCIQERNVPLDGDPFSGHVGTCDDPQPPKLVRCRLQGLGIPPTDVVDLSTWLSDAFWTVLDETRDLFYIAGLAPTGELTVLSATTGGVVDVLTTVPGAAAAGGIGAMTILTDGLYFITTQAGGRQSAWRYSFGAGELLRIVDEGSAAWPLMSGAGIGTAFIVGTTASCNENCACPPQLALTRVFPLLEDEDLPDNCIADPLRPGCCGLSHQEVMQFACLYYFDYAITLCDDRTLSYVKIQGTRGQAYIEGVGPVSAVTDWSTIPLTGRLYFNIAGDSSCGPVETELRITLIDSQDCCATFTRDLFCCKCCPAGGSVSVEADACDESYLENPACVTFGDCADGQVFCETIDSAVCPGFPPVHDYQWFKFTFAETESSPCGLDVEIDRVCYIVDWDGMEARGGGVLPGLISAGTELRVLWHAQTPAANPICVRVWAYDALGDVECRSLIGVFEFSTGCVYPLDAPEEDITDCCRLRGYTRWECSEEGAITA